MIGADDQLVLAPGLLVLAVTDLPAAVRDELGDDGRGAFALTRAHGRRPSTLVDGDLAGLLEEFRAPSTVADAIVRAARRLALDPDEVLTRAYPALRACVEQGYLVVAGSEDAHPVEVVVAPGARVAAGTVVRCVQVLDDTEVHQLALDGGGFAALKVLRRPRTLGDDALEREADVLRHLGGRVAPRLLAEGEVDGRPWIAMEWCDGVPVTRAAAVARGGRSADATVLRLARRVAEAYAGLHDAGVVHGDVHPGNVLVGPSDVVRVIDFGLARLADAGPADRPLRGGVPAYFDPGYAAALRAGHPPPPATLASDQYALGAVLYEVLSGAPPIDHALDGDEALRRIAENRPLPFAARGRRPWPEVEQLLQRALAKDPNRRFPSTRDLARLLAAVTPPTPPPTAARQPALDAVLRSVLDAARPGGRWAEQGLPGDGPTCSVVYGAAGVAAALLRIAVVRADAELLAAADEWIERAARDASHADAFSSSSLGVTAHDVGLVSPYHRLSGVHAVQALVRHAFDDGRARRAALDAFVAESHKPCRSLDLTLGRAGTLLVTAMLLEATGRGRSVDRLTGLGDATLRDLWAALDGMPPVADGEIVTFLGMAHGWAGLLLATLRWCAAAAAAPPPGLRGRLDQLAELAQPAGAGARWPLGNRRAGALSRASMPGWCHGSAGYVHLWTTAHAVLGDDRWIELAERAATDAATSPNSIDQLCCGTAGQAYGLLALHGRTGERRWLDAAVELASRAAGAARDAGTTRLPASLYKGHVGIAVLVADLDDPAGASMPFFGNGG